MVRIFFFCLLTLSLCGCATSSLHHNKNTTPKLPVMSMSYLQQGKRYFEDGYYKRAMRLLLPLACDGNEEAQYAVGYMYYYGYGVGQDIDVGRFWIQRSANQGFKPAIEALRMVSKKRDEDFDAREKFVEGEVPI